MPYKQGGISSMRNWILLILLAILSFSIGKVTSNVCVLEVTPLGTKLLLLNGVKPFLIVGSCSLMLIVLVLLIDDIASYFKK